MSSICPLCGAQTRFHAYSEKRAFHACATCGLIHLLPEHRLGLEEERGRYLLHQNSPQDSGYRTFLNQLLEPLSRKLFSNAIGIDYGCGPGPTVGVMMRERGFAMNEFDPFFAVDETVLNQQYDFITCTEAAEHFFNPKKEFERLDSLLKPGGYLGIMTAVYDPHKIVFSEWYYPKDPTHVSIYTSQTMDWIAKHLGWTVSSLSENTGIFYKPN